MKLDNNNNKQIFLFMNVFLKHKYILVLIVLIAPLGIKGQVLVEDFNTGTLNTAIWTPVTFTGHGPGQCAVACVSPGCCESASYQINSSCSSSGFITNLSSFTSGADCNNVGSTARSMITHTFASPNTIFNPVIKIKGKRESISLGPFGTIRSGVLVSINGVDASSTAQINFKVFFDIDRAGFDNVRDKCADCSNPYALDILIGGAGSSVCNEITIDIKTRLGWQCINALNSITLMSRCGNCVIGAASTTSYSYNFDDLRVWGATDCFSPLPITLVSFTAAQHKNNVQLDWTTASEINNDFFTIERSTDALNFEPIGTVKGAGNSNTIKNYQYLDITSNLEHQTSNTLYYRLKQTDFDGTVSYSPIQSVVNKYNDNETFKVIQNISLKELIILSEIPINDVSLHIINTQGKCLYESILNDKKTKLSTKDIPAGVYLIYLFDKKQLNFIKKELIY